MYDKIVPILKSSPIVPLIQSDDPVKALKITQALMEGGVKVFEVVLRTDAAMDCLASMVKEWPEACVGAGTVLSVSQTHRVIDTGAKFVVSPGLYEPSVELTQKAGIPLLPGISTATELQRAWNLGIRIVKFFPASLCGGPKMLSALSSVFRDVQFMPTGGVNADNLKDYLSLPSVLACGGSWLTPTSAIEKGNFKKLTVLASEAHSLAKELSK